MEDDLLADSIEQLLAGRSTPQTVRAIEGGGSAAALWQAIEDSGFCDALIGEEHGGAGLALQEVFAVFEACGRHALPLPLAQTMVARAQLAGPARRPPAGPIALASAAALDQPVRVVCGAVSDWVLLQVGSTLRLLDARQAEREVEPGSVDASLRWPDALLASAERFDAAVELRCTEAVLLAAQLSGAMRRILEATLQYANDRAQFGRSIGKFQAIQHQLSVMAEHAEAARMAARMACATSRGWPEPLAAAVAKARTSEAAVAVAAIAHGVHGAIGITDEYDLQLLTRRLHAWRTATGSESYWNIRLGRALHASRASAPEFVLGELTPRAAERE